MILQIIFVLSFYTFLTNHHNLNLNFIIHAFSYYYFSLRNTFILQIFFKFFSFGFRKMSSLICEKAFIDGKWVGAASGKTFQVKLVLGKCKPKLKLTYLNL
jgi:hypothetical protein